MVRGAASASVGSGRLSTQKPHCPAPPWPPLVSHALGHLSGQSVFNLLGPRTNKPLKRQNWWLLKPLRQVEVAESLAGGTSRQPQLWGPAWGRALCCRNGERYCSWESSFFHLTLCTDRRSISNFTLHETAFLADLIGLLAPPRVSCISPLWLLWQQIERGWEQLGMVKKMRNLPRFTNLPDPARPSSHGLPALAAGLGGDCC